MAIFRVIPGRIPAASRPAQRSAFEYGQAGAGELSHHEFASIRRYCDSAHSSAAPSRRDTKHWLASPNREEFFGPLGIAGIRTFVDPQNPTRAAVLFEVPDMDAMMAAMQTEGAAEAVAHDGVLPETVVMHVEA